MKDYYDMLQVSPNAGPDVIEAAYRRLARKYHPDVNRDPAATERMRELNEAYEVLSDSTRRAEYDALLARAPARGGSARPDSGRTTPPPPPSGQPSPSQGPAPEEPAAKRRRVRRLWLGLVAGLLLALTVAGAATSAILVTGGQRPDKAPTQVYRYAPSVAVAVQPPGEENACWTGSIATGRYDAFRCHIGNFIHDPCFTYGLHTLVCPGDPRTAADDVAFTFDVTTMPSTVPHAGVREANVWFMVVNGQGCYALTGTAPVVAGKSFPFACSGPLYCTPPVEGSERFLSDCWRSDSGQENTYIVAAVWY
jgi:hypothetical protein